MSESEEQDKRETGADIAQRVAISTAVGVTVQLGVLLAFSWAVQHRDDLKPYARRAMRAIRRDRTPGDAGLLLAEHAADVSLISHEGAGG